MSKSGKFLERRKDLVKFALILFMITPVGVHVFLGVTNWFGHRIATSFLKTLPKTPGVNWVSPTPSSK